MAVLRKYKIQIICISMGFILFFIAKNFANTSDSFINNNFVKREGYSAYNKSYEVYVDGLLDREVLVKLPVSHRSYSDEEIDEVFEKCMKVLESAILGKNPSLQEVSDDLNLINSIKEYGILVEWISETPELIDAMGTVNNENLKEAKDAVLKVFLTDRKREAQYLINVRVIPKNYTKEELSIKKFMSKLEAIDKENISKEGYTLPDSFEGKKLSYRQEESKDIHIIWIMGIVIAILLYVKDMMALKDKREYKAREMLLDYPEIVSKLMVFIGAGLSVRSAWERIVIDYENLAGGKRFAYEEMSSSLTKLKTGVHESRVYKDFGRNCAIKQYMKLASLLDQNRKSGVNNLRQILSVEMASAWEERINIARRQGEEASTKLLLPLLMLLIVVLIIIMLPAMMAFK
jgi:hypothetical protein